MLLHYFVNVKYSKFAPTAVTATADDAHTEENEAVAAVDEH